MSQRQISARLVGACVAGVVLSGCLPQGTSDLHQWVQTQQANTQPRIAPLQEPKVFFPQAYEVAQGVEPFNKNKLLQVLNRDSANNAHNMALLDAEHKRPKEDLEHYALDTMAFVGNLRQAGNEAGLLRVNNLIYQVRVGNYLGQNYGRIVAIQDNHIQLREIVQDPSGDWVEKMTTLNLQEGGH